MVYKNYSKRNCKDLNQMAWYPSLIVSQDHETVLGKHWLPIKGWSVYDERCKLMKEQSGEDKIRLVLGTDGGQFSKPNNPDEVNLDVERNKKTILIEQHNARMTGKRSKSNYSKRMSNR